MDPMMQQAQPMTGAGQNTAEPGTAGMNPRAAMQILSRYGITEQDLPLVVQAVQSVISAGAVQGSTPAQAADAEAALKLNVDSIEAAQTRASERGELDTGASDDLQAKMREIWRRRRPQPAAY